MCYAPPSPLLEVIGITLRNSEEGALAVGPALGDGNVAGADAHQPRDAPDHVGLVAAGKYRPSCGGMEGENVTGRTQRTSNGKHLNNRPLPEPRRSPFYAMNAAVHTANTINLAGCCCFPPLVALPRVPPSPSTHPWPARHIYIRWPKCPLESPRCSFLRLAG